MRFLTFKPPLLENGLTNPQFFFCSTPTKPMILYNISKFQPIRRNSFLRKSSFQLPRNSITISAALCTMYYCSAGPGGPASPGGLRLAAPAGAQRCPEYPLPYSPPKGYYLVVYWLCFSRKKREKEGTILGKENGRPWQKLELSLGRFGG